MTLSSYGSTGLPPFPFVGPVHSAEFLSAVEKPPAKQQKRKTESSLGRPLGSKTLCNACGVWFNAGWLYHEYRPVCSPTFSQEMHLNSHRKVLKMRRKRRNPDRAGRFMPRRDLNPSPYHIDFEDVES